MRWLDVLTRSEGRWFRRSSREAASGTGILAIPANVCPKMLRLKSARPKLPTRHPPSARRTPPRTRHSTTLSDRLCCAFRLVGVRRPRRGRWRRTRRPRRRRSSRTLPCASSSRRCAASSTKRPGRPARRPRRRRRAEADEGLRRGPSRRRRARDGVSTETPRRAVAATRAPPRGDAHAQRGGGADDVEEAAEEVVVAVRRGRRGAAADAERGHGDSVARRAGVCGPSSPSRTRWVRPRGPRRQRRVERGGRVRVGRGVVAGVRRGPAPLTL